MFRLCGFSTPACVLQKPAVRHTNGCWQTQSPVLSQSPPKMHSGSSHSVPTSGSGSLTQPVSGSPVCGSHPSSVQTLSSSQKLSSGVKTHWPSSGLHSSSVHSLESSQIIGVPMHVPSWQASVVQASPSEQVLVSSLVCTQTADALHRSSVHSLPSLVQGAPAASSLGRHTPSSQMSGFLQSVSLRSPQVLVSSLVCTQTADALHRAAVPALPSRGQGAPAASSLGRHTPSSQMSGFLQSVSLRSPQVLVSSLVCTQTADALHRSSVHSLPSLVQGAPAASSLGRHTPSSQMSGFLQSVSLRSPQVLVSSLVCTHPLAGLQLSSVQALPSSQLMRVPTQVPDSQ